jgi:hypothetical protein
MISAGAFVRFFRSERLMLNKTTTTACFGVIALVYCTRAAAAPGPVIDLARLVNGSDVIAVGEIVSVQDRGTESFPYAGRTFSGRRMEGFLRVYRIVKGSTGRHSLSFKFINPDDFIGYGSILRGQFGMFFLKGSQRSGYEPTSPYYPFILAAATSPAKQYNNVPDQIVEEIRTFMDSPATSQGERRMAVNWLGTLRTENSIGALRKLLRDADPEASIEAATGLMKWGDLHALKKAVELLINPPPVSNETLFWGLAQALGDGIRAPSAIPSLVPLLSAKEPYARRAGASALRETHSKDAIGPLSFALYDPDHMVRYQAVIGLAEITGQNEWGPSIDHFAKQEDRFLEHWRDWVRDHGSRIDK